MATVDEVKRNIVSIYERRRSAVYALCLSYAARALNIFRSTQAKELWWQNQTGQAYARMFANARLEENVVSWFMAHAVQYGVYLELSNDRKHEALRPIIESLIPEFKRDLQSLYGAGGESDTSIFDRPSVESTGWVG